METHEIRIFQNLVSVYPPFWGLHKDSGVPDLFERNGQKGAYSLILWSNRDISKTRRREAPPRAPKLRQTQFWPSSKVPAALAEHVHLCLFFKHVVGANVTAAYEAS